MSPEDLGRLTGLDVRKVWPNEANDFTPWLLANPDRLAEALGIDLEIYQAEHPVGDFRLDLVGRDLTNGCELIVENQLTATDHIHLGQLMTYAAGTKAQTIVWIATEFREEHREAIRWLNQLGGDEVRFFGIEVSVVQIGDSRPAPLFRLRAEPNEWRAVVAQHTGELSNRETQYREFWALFLTQLRERHPGWSNAKKPPKASWFSMPSPYMGCNWVVSFAMKRRTMSELYIDTGDKMTNEEIFSRFKASREVIESAFGGLLEWEELPHRRACRIAHYGHGHVTDAAQHEAFVHWLLDSQERLRNALAAAHVDLGDLA